MRFISATGKRRRAGFTLAEVLAALLFMAIVIPVAVQGLRIANQAGQVAVRKGLAAQLADKILNEAVVMTLGGASDPGTRAGTLQQGPYSFRYQTQNDTWTVEAMRRVTVDVFFLVQGQEYDVRLTTLLDSSMQ